MKIKAYTCAVMAAVTGAATAGPNKNDKPPATAEQASKIEAALPEKAPARPKQERRIMVFTRCEGFVHASIPVGAKAMELLGKKTGAFSTVEASDMSEKAHESTVEGMESMEHLSDVIERIKRSSDETSKVIKQSMILRSKPIC